jgi:hypothetical protein
LQSFVNAAQVEWKKNESEKHDLPKAWHDPMTRPFASVAEQRAPRVSAFHKKASLSRSFFESDGCILFLAHLAHWLLTHIPRDQSSLFFFFSAARWPFFCLNLTSFSCCSFHSGSNSFLFCSVCQGKPEEMELKAPGTSFDTLGCRSN